PGGRLADGRPTSVVEAYSPANGAWRPVAPLPRPLSGGLALSDGGRLYLFGGWDGSAYTPNAYAYDPAADAWSELEPMRHAKGGSAGGLLTNRLYMVGGQDADGPLASCEAYDIAAAEWAACPALSQARAGAGAAAIANSALYVLGGGPDGDLSFGEAFDLQRGAWERVEMPILAADGAWYNLGVTSLETHIYALGGRRAGEITADNYLFIPFIHRTFLPTVGNEN
ncbi:MAG: kelch repeat-containing protein, partial [Candidatus Promineifilaceae bacterium]